jgi:1,4-alpha-glucan branching enzyme
MAIKKQFVKSKPICKVTFSVPVKEAVEVAVIGDFNNWDPQAGALAKLKNGTFKGVFELDINKTYEFKYLVDGAYKNESEADEQKWNEFAGAENSVITL